MKLFFSTFLLWTMVQANEMGCLTTSEVDYQQDYFPDKAAPEDSLYWDVSYHNTYKIVQNKDTNASYLLYQCGSEPPADELDAGRHAAVMEIPIGQVGITQTPMITYLEQLNLLDRVAAFLTDPAYISSPCFKKAVESGQVLTLQEQDPAQPPVGNNSQLVDMPAFIFPYQTVPFVQTVQVSVYLEKTNKAIFEWEKFYSTFFNQEAAANELVAAASHRFDCVANEAAGVVDDSPDKPVVLWAYYSTACEGWDVAKCPNYYCEFAAACQADILYSTSGSVTSCGGLSFMTTEELVEFGKDADHWIFPAPYWNETYAANKGLLDQMKSVQNQQVYDYQGMGENAWFEQRFAEYYDVLQDFCSVVGTTTGLTGNRGWFRNVATEQVGDLGSCSEYNQSGSILPYDFGECRSRSVTSDGSIVMATGSVLGVTAAVLAILVL